MKVLKCKREFLFSFAEIWFFSFWWIWAEHRPPVSEIFNRLHWILYICWERKLFLTLRGAERIMRVQNSKKCFCLCETLQQSLCTVLPSRWQHSSALWKNLFIFQLIFLEVIWIKSIKEETFWWNRLTEEKNGYICWMLSSWKRFSCCWRWYRCFCEWRWSY